MCFINRTVCPKIQNTLSFSHVALPVSLKKLGNNALISLHVNIIIQIYLSLFNTKQNANSRVAPGFCHGCHICVYIRAYREYKPCNWTRCQFWCELLSFRHISPVVVWLLTLFVGIKALKYKRERNSNNLFSETMTPICRPFHTNCPSIIVYNKYSHIKDIQCRCLLKVFTTILKLLYINRIPFCCKCVCFASTLLIWGTILFAAEYQTPTLPFRSWELPVVGTKWFSCHCQKTKHPFQLI